MKIYITSGIGTGPTTLAAFDAALNSAGIANYNLLRLSSVIPPAAKVIADNTGLRGVSLPGQWGDRLYVVMAEARTVIVGESVWAGVGWVQDEVSGRGLFVEHEGASEADVRNQIQLSLQALLKTRNMPDQHIEMQVAGTTCNGEPVCALVAAVYQSSDWLNSARVIED